MGGLALVWLTGVRDLRFRARRFLFAVGGAALVFAVTLVLSGFGAAFDIEADGLVADFGAAAVVISASAPGPFSSSRPIPDTTAEALVASGAATRADPLLAGRQPLLEAGDEPGEERFAYVVAHRLGGLGSPVVVDGRAAAEESEIVVDRSLGLGVGEQVTLSGEELTVVGRTTGRTVFLGLPLVYASIDLMQRLLLADQPLATMILTDTVPADPGPGLRTVTIDAAGDDLIEPLHNAVVTVSLLRILLWAVAAIILASVLYVSVLERTRDLAVLKATGVGTRSLVAALALQAIVLSLIAVSVACVLALLVVPVFPLAIAVPSRLMVQLAVVGVVVGAVGGTAGLRQAVRVDPAAAFA